MTEQPTPRQIRQGIAEKLAGLGIIDTVTGHTAADRAADAARFARFAEAVTPMVEAPPAQTSMRPNPLQGHSSASVATPEPTNVADRIRARLAKHTL